MIFEEKFIFFPSSYPDGFYDPEGSILKAEDHWFAAEDGTKLHSWFVRHDKAIGTLLLFHGNAGNLSHRAEVIRRHRQSGFNVFIFDYRGYGRSEGTPTETGVYNDGRAAYDYLIKVPGVDSTRLILFGTSLGGAVAVDVALHRKPAAMILESTFSSARDVAKVAYPFLPIRFILRSELDSESKIRSISVPLLFLHGVRDSIIPIGLGRKLFQAANEPKTFYEIELADHNDTYFVGGREYQERIRSFALEVLGHARHK